jgi:hypothetical protein
MEYPNLPERKLIDVPAISRASRGTCTSISQKISESRPAGISGRHLHDTMVGAQQPRHDGRGHISSCTYITTSTSTSRERGTTSGREGRLGSEIGVVEVLLVVLQ